MADNQSVHVVRNWTMTQYMGGYLLPVDPIRRQLVLDSLVRGKFV